MPEDTKLKTCSSCAVWPTEFRLANKVTSCASLGFSHDDSCEKWTDQDPSRVTAFVRVREPALTEIMSNPEIRAPWKAFKEKVSSTTAQYSDGYYYYFFDESSSSEAEKFAATLSKEEYVQKSLHAVLPVRLANLEEEERTKFESLAKALQE